MDELREIWLRRLQTFWAVVVVPAGGIRVVLLAILAALLLSADPKAAKALGFGLGLVVAALAFLHWTRKVLMPYLDQKLYIEKALKDPIASAIVFCATRAFDAAILAFLLFAVLR